MAETSTRTLVERVGEAVSRFISAADRTSYESSLFDMRNRTVLGMYALHDHQRWFYGEIAQRCEPRELGRSMRRPCAPLFTPLISAIPWAYLLPRENEVQLGRWSEERDADLAWIMDFWEQVASDYRPDGALLPHEAGDTQLILDQPDVDALRAILDAEPHEVDDAQRLVARLEMMNFVISGEIRGRNFYHGPYPGSEPDRVMIVQEFVALQKRHQPWVEGLLEFPVENVAVVREVAGVDLVFDMFGFMVAEGGDYRGGITRTVAVTVEDGVARRLDDEELEEFGRHAQTAIRGAYERIATWDDDYRVLYGLHHYLNESAPYAEAVGAPELIGQLRERMEESGQRRLRELRADDGAPGWAKLADPAGPFTLPRDGM